MTSSSSKTGTDSATRSGEGVVDGIKREGQRALDNAKDGVERIAEDKKSLTADYLKALATAAGSGASELERQGHPGTAAFVSNIAEDFDGIVQEMDDRPVGKLVDDVANFAAERPVLFFGAAFVIGLGAARFAKSSAERSNTQDAPDPNRARVPGKGANV